MFDWFPIVPLPPHFEYLFYLHQAIAGVVGCVSFLTGMLSLIGWVPVASRNPKDLHAMQVVRAGMLLLGVAAVFLLFGLYVASLGLACFVVLCILNFIRGIALLVRARSHSAEN